MSTPGDVGRLPSIATTNISLQAIVDADRRMDELSTARVIGEAAEAIHKLQKNGQALGTLSPLAIVVSSAGVRVDPPNGPTTAYCAPERLKGQTGDRRSDVFSLGVVLWEALAHARLFEGATDAATKKAVLEKAIRPPSELNANVPAELDAICNKALARDPADRYQSTKVMAAEISAVLDDASYPESNERIAAYLETTFPAGAPTPARSKTPSATGAAVAAKLAAAGKTQMMGSLVSSDLLPPPASTEAAPQEEVKGESTKRIGAAPVTPAAPAASAPAAAPAAPETPTPVTPTPVTPSAPIVAAAEPAGKRPSAQRAAVSIASAETVQTPALVPTATPVEATDTPTTGKIAGLPAMPPGASASDVDTKPEPLLKTTPIDGATANEPKPSEPAPRPSQPAVDPRDAVSLPRRAKSESGEMLGGWGWSDSHDPGPDGVYEDEVDEEKVRRKRLLVAIGGALGVIALIIIIAVAAGGGETKKTDEEEKASVAEGPSRTAPEPTPAPVPEPTPVTTPPPTPAVVIDPTAGSASGSGSGSAVAVDPEAAKAQELAAKAEAERLAKEAEKAKAEEARLAKEAAENAKAEELRLAKEAEKAKAEQARLAKEEAAKAKAEQARLAKEEAAKKKAAEPPKKKTEPKSSKKVAKAPTPVDPYAETAPKVNPATAYKQGFQQYVRGDTAGALATFKGSLAANPGYAPTYRGLGLVYEKMGNKGQARSAFRRYLRLSPKASDAEQIRERMEKL